MCAKSLLRVISHQLSAAPSRCPERSSTILQWATSPPIAQYRNCNPIGPHTKCNITFTFIYILSLSFDQYRVEGILRPETFNSSKQKPSVFPSGEPLVLVVRSPPVSGNVLSAMDECSSPSLVLVEDGCKTFVVHFSRHKSVKQGSIISCFPSPLLVFGCLQIQIVLCN